MNFLKAVVIFYQKLIVPTLLFSIIINLFGAFVVGPFSFKTLGISYVLLGLLFQFLIYEIGYSEEYYFYFNLGLNKYILWLSNLVIGLIIGIVISLL